jgi:hypothetical protein
VTRKWTAAVVCISLSLALPAAGRAAGSLALDLDAGLGGAYLRVVDVEAADPRLEDVQGRESLATTLAFDNPFLHLEVNYRVTAVQLRSHPELDYIDQHVNLRLDADRWLRRLTGNGRLTIISNLIVNPSLPPIDTGATPIPNSPAATPVEGTSGAADRLRSDLLTAGNLVNIREDRSGYAYNYGLIYEDELGPFSGYRVGWNVTDNRYNSDVVPDSATLRASGEYFSQVRSGRASVGVSHSRVVRGPNKELKTYGIQGALAQGRYRSGWRLAPGVTYRSDRKAYGASLDSGAFLRRPLLSYSASYGTEYAVVTVGDVAISRVHRAGFGIRPTQVTKYPRRANVSAAISTRTRQYSFLAEQAAQLTPTVLASIGYERAKLRWREEGTDTVRHRYGDTVLLAVNWQFQ